MLVLPGHATPMAALLVAYVGAGLRPIPFLGGPGRHGGRGSGAGSGGAGAGAGLGAALGWDGADLL